MAINTGNGNFSVDFKSNVNGNTLVKNNSIINDLSLNGSQFYNKSNANNSNEVESFDLFTDNKISQFRSRLNSGLLEKGLLDAKISSGYKNGVLVERYDLTDSETFSLISSLSEDIYATALDGMKNCKERNFVDIYYPDGVNYPVFYFGGIYNYNNLDVSLLDVKKDENFSNYYKNMLNERLSKCNSGRERAVATALFFGSDLPQLPYFLGGCHNFKELESFSPSNILDKITKIKSVDDYNTFDCSSFNTCCFYNGGIDIKKYIVPFKGRGGNSLLSGEIGKMNQKHPINSGVARAGDAVWCDGHVGIVVENDNLNDEIIIAHSSSSSDGVAYLVLDSTNGKVKRTHGPEPAKNIRLGETYFTHIVPVQYEDEIRPMPYTI